MTNISERRLPPDLAGLPSIRAEVAFEVKYVLSMALVAFGGLCAGFQTKCIVERAGLCFRQYIKEKLITAMVTSLLAIIFLMLYSHFNN